MRKYKFFLSLNFFLLTGLKVISQQVFLMKDTSVITCQCFFYDEGGYQNGYNPGQKTMTFTSTDGSPFGVNFDSLRFAFDSDRLTVFDGNTIQAPVLTVINNFSGKRSFKTTGPSVTFQFLGGGTTEKLGWRAKLSCLNNPRETKFSTVTNKIGDGNIDLYDFDKDGDMDILQGGTIYRNESFSDSLYFFEKIYTPIGNWKNSSITSADFDQDGDKDLFVIGESANQGFQILSRLYLNDGNGRFISSPQQFSGAFSGQCKTLDFNNDGKMDISYAGKSGNNVAIFKLYMNAGSGTFTELNTSVAGLANSSLDWADYDNDGDKDLLLQGDNFSSPVTKLYINNNQVLTETNIGLINTTSGSIQWANINNDNKPDIINSGVQSVGNINAITPQILINNYPLPFQAFSNNLPALYQTNFAFADYDLDNDIDILMSGRSNGAPNSYICKKNNSGSYQLISISASPGASSVFWADLTNDGRPEAFVASSSSLNESYFFKYDNKFPDAFPSCSLPLPFMSGNGGEVLLSDLTGDGVQDMIYVGELNDLDCFGGPNSILIKGLGWNKIPVIKFSNYLNITSNPIGFGNTFWRWGDLDNDGLIDAVVNSDPAGSLGNANNIIFFKNNNNTNFSQIYNGHPGQNFIYQAKLIDLNNDKANELFIAPNGIFKWNNGTFITINENPQECPQYYSCIDQYVDFADYNKDGYVDCAISVSGFIKILKNDKTGKLNPITTFIGLNKKVLKWVDLDNDNDLDILGSDGNTIENEGNDNFVVKGSLLVPSSGLAAGDFNKDGYIDVFSLPSSDIFTSARLYYNQNGSFYFSDKTPIVFPDVRNDSYNAGTVACDFDNDGDQDIAYSRGACRYNGILMNYYNYLHPNIHLQNPNNSEIFTTGTNVNLKWAGNFLSSNVSLYLSIDSGATYNLIGSNITSGRMSGNYNWLVQAPGQSSKCLLKIIDQQNNLVDITDKTFTITQTTATTVRTEESNHINIFPNPVLNDFNLIINDLAFKNIQLTIFDSHGNQKRQYRFLPSAQRISYKLYFDKNLPAGLYFFRFNIGKELITKKVIKL